MRIMFWNTHRNGSIDEFIDSLVSDYAIDTLILAEYNGKCSLLEYLLKQNGRGLLLCNTLGCSRLNIFTNYVDVQSEVQTDYFSIQIFQQSLVLCSVHLMSDAHRDCSYERAEKAREIMEDIQRIYDTIGSNLSMIIGDFNASPYSTECLAANAFHGLPTMSEHEKPTRTVYRKEYTKYYNPMWNFLGDSSNPPGTYYLNQAQLNTPRWYTLDQVILSQGLIPRFVKKSLQIITDCGKGSLQDENGRPNKEISDHFPIICEVII